jgi:hypothetical protein
MKYTVVVSAVLALSVTPVLACSMNKNTSASLPAEGAQTTASIETNGGLQSDRILVARQPSSAAPAPIVTE